MFSLRYLRSEATVNGNKIVRTTHEVQSFFH